MDVRYYEITFTAYDQFEIKYAGSLRNYFNLVDRISQIERFLGPLLMNYDVYRRTYMRCTVYTMSFRKKKNSFFKPFIYTRMKTEHN